MFVFLYLILLVFSIWHLSRKIKQGFSCETILKAVFTIYYILVPFIVSLFENSPKFSAYNSTYFNVIATASDSEKLRAFFLTLFTYLLIIGFSRIRFVINKKTTNKDTLFEYDTINLNHSAYFLGIVFTAVGLICFLEIAIELGGIPNALALGSVIRGYRVDNAIYLSAVGALCKTLSFFAIGGFLCLFSIEKKTLVNKILVIISGGISFCVLLFDAGRGPILIFLGCIIFAIYYRMGRKVLWIIITGFMIILLCSSSIEFVIDNISKGLPIFNNVTYSMEENVLASITDLSFPYANILSITKLVDFGGYNYGLDFITWIFQILPHRLFNLIGISIPNIVLVTSKISNYYLTSGMSLGGTPADFISYGFFQGGIIGIFFTCLIYSVVLKYIDDTINYLPKSYSIFIFKIGFVIYSLITGGDFPLVIKNNLYLIIIIIVFYNCLKKKYEVNNAIKN